MATTTTNFGLKKYEGTDLFNPLTFENPNSDDIDAAMFYNKQHLCVDATELTTGTVHALTKSDTDSPLFSFTATSVYHAGDTFTLNGAAVTALLTSGETLPEGAYVIGSRVLGFVSGGGSLITLFIMKTTDLSPINSFIGNTDISQIGDGTITGAIDALNDEIDEKFSDYNLLGTATGSGDWQNINIATLANYKEIMVCFLASTGSIINPVRVSTKFFKYSLNTDSVYLSIRGYFATNIFVDYAVRYSTDTVVKFYGSVNPAVRIGIYGIK